MMLWRSGDLSSSAPESKMGNFMDQKTKGNLEQMEKSSRFVPGVLKIERGECPLGPGTPMKCMFCPYGHMLECHYPMTCDEAMCSHYEQDTEAFEEGIYRE